MNDILLGMWIASVIVFFWCVAGWLVNIKSDLDRAGKWLIALNGMCIVVVLLGLIIQLS